MEASNPKGSVSVQQPPTRHSSLASYGLGCGLAGLLAECSVPCTHAIGGVVGLVLCVMGLCLSALGLRRIRRSGVGQLKGRGEAIGGIVTSSLGIAVFGVFLALVIPAASTALDLARGLYSAERLERLCKAAIRYSEANKGRLPSASDWPQALGIRDEDLMDTSQPQAGRCYAINAGVAGKGFPVPQARKTVLFFECAPGTPPAGGPKDLPPKPRYGGSHGIGFCDGHVERVFPDELGGLIWDSFGTPGLDMPRP